MLFYKVFLRKNLKKINKNIIENVLNSEGSLMH